MKYFNRTFVIIIISFIFSLVINLTYLNLFFKNLESNQYLYPSANSEKIYERHDLDDNFQWVRRAFENNSIFKLSANIKEINLEDRHHFQSSRGLSYYISGLFLNFDNDSLNVVILLKVIFLTFSIFLSFSVLKFYHRDIFIKIIIVTLSIIFANKLFGGVLNPYHYVEYFFNIKNYFISRGIDRIPNNLISNIFIILNFLLFKKYFKSPKLLNLIYCLIVLILSGFISPIIFIVYSLCVGIFYLYNFSLNKELNSFLKKLFLLISLFLPVIIFHYLNLNLVNDGSLDSPQWTGNYLYDLEIFIGPLIVLIVFYSKKIRLYKTEVLFFISQLIFFLSASIYDPYLASKINENFIYLNALISFSLLFRVFFQNNKNLNLKLIFILFILFCLYIFLQHHFQYTYFYLIIFLCLILILAILIKKLIFKVIISFSAFLILFLLSLNHYQVDNLKFNKKNEYTQLQKKLINHINKNDEIKETYISLDFGLLKNLSIHTSHNIYFINITNTNLNKNELMKRLFDIFYLYGFTNNDLIDFLQQNKSQNISSKNNYNKKNLNVMFTNIYHMKANSLDEKIFEISEEYKKYLINKKYINMSFFNRCIINPSNEKFIKKNSFYDNLKNKKPIYYNYFKIYNCNIN